MNTIRRERIFAEQKRNREEEKKNVVYKNKIM